VSRRGVRSNIAASAAGSTASIFRRTSDRRASAHGDQEQGPMAPLIQSGAVRASARARGGCKLD
jgi:hypothetical protein